MDISENTKLTNISVFGTNLSKIDVGQNTDLVSLNCSGAKNITQLDVSNNPELQSLSCEDTGINELDVTHNSKLVGLVCDSTGISALDLSKNTALKNLNCGNTNISSLDISKNTALEILQCYNLPITKLDAGNNDKLKSLYCYDSKIKSLNISASTQLDELNCANTPIEELDVSQNIALKILNCYKTAIKSLDVSNCTSLTYLDCGANDNLSSLNVKGATALETLYTLKTSIKELDVSQNTSLKILYCYETQIGSLNVSTNTQLEELNCSNTLIKEIDVTMLSKLQKLWTWHTGIQYLDVSHNSQLSLLDTPQTNLAYLNLGTTNLNELYMDLLSEINLTVSNETFNIKEAFKGIDVDKIEILSGGSLDKSNGIVSGYNVNIPIVYKYACGLSQSGDKTLQVTLKLMKLKTDSTISITGSLDKTYDRNVVDNPAVTKTGSTGEVTYQWEQKDSNGTWKLMTSAPKDVGTYRVSATVAADDNYKEAISDSVIFTIVPKNIDEIIVSNITSETDTLIVKDKDEILVQGKDYDLIKIYNENQISVTITFKGNYKGIMTRSYTLDKNDPNKLNVTVNEESSRIVLDMTNKIIEAINNGESLSNIDSDTAVKIQEAINQGDYIETVIEIKKIDESTLNKNDMSLIEKVLAKKGHNAEVEYFDLSILLKSNGKTLGKITKLDEPIHVSIKLPENLKGEGITYSIFRVHNDKVDIIDAKVNSDGTLEFETDLFSTYAIAYTNKNQPTITPPVNSTPDVVTPPKSESIVQPNNKVKTEDQSYIFMYVVIGIISLGVIALMNKKRYSK